jgi:L-histidine Nalpha-methyltransferase
MSTAAKITLRVPSKTPHVTGAQAARPRVTGPATRGRAARAPFAEVTIHRSQFPEAVRRDLLTSLRTRRVNHKFHYDSVKQTQKWLALHQAFSPTRNDADCRAIYSKAFESAAEKIQAKCVHVIGLGCGGGQKDTRLLKLLKSRGREICYTPCDVSTAMVLVARATALAVVPEKNCFSLVCDLSRNAEHRLGENQNASSTRRNGARRSDSAGDLAAFLNQRLTPHASRLITFFGMIPNFEPDQILPTFASLVRPDDFLLFSANLAPGEHYADGMKKILPQYDNALTADWLMTFLLDLGIGNGDGKLEFAIEDGGPDLKRVVARFHFSRARQIKMDGEGFNFRRGESIRLFFSYRYTPERVRKILGGHGFEVCDQWIAKSGEEGVFLVRRRGVSAERLT